MEEEEWRRRKGGGGREECKRYEAAGAIGQGRSCRRTEELSEEGGVMQ